MTAADDFVSFSRLIIALDPWLDQVVIIGGWAHRLYRLHPYAQALEYAPLTTRDADIAIPPTLLARGQDIRERLLANGFTEEFLGDDQPPATHYRSGDGAAGFYAEFLTPLVGGEHDREGRRKATVQIAGVTSQRLRHIDLLLKHPWAVDLDLTGTERERRRVRIANPASFLAQKVLIHAKRSRDDRAKDILYMHDTLEVFGGRLAELRDEWERRIAPQLRHRHRSKVLKASYQLFAEATDAIREAALIAVGRSISSESLREAR